MTVVVGSWEFYFCLINKRPLKDWVRFTVDVVIVSFYIILLISTELFGTFIIYMDVIMSLCIVWDVLSMRTFPEQYGLSVFSLRNTLNVYLYGAFSALKAEVERKSGPFITVWWFLIFVSVFVIHEYYQQDFYNVTAGTALAYLLYRMDQVKHWSWLLRVGCSMSVFVILFSVHVCLQ